MINAKIQDSIKNLNWEDPNYEQKFGEILNFLNADLDPAELKAELIQFSKLHNLAEIAECIPPNKIMTEGRIAYCANRGAKFKDSSIARVIKFVEQYRSVFENKIDEERTDPRMQSKIDYAHRYSGCRALIIQSVRNSVSNGSNTRELSTFVRDTIKKYGIQKSSFIREMLDDFENFVKDAKNDESTAMWVKPASIVVESLDFMLNNRKKSRNKSRQFAGNNPNFDFKGEKAAAKIKIKDEDDEYGIRTIDPTHLVGSDLAVIFNTKNRHCEVFTAAAGTKLSITGSRITNFDESQSYGKTIRKPDEFLQQAKKATSVKRIGIIMEYINGKAWTPTGKINKHCVILKVL